MQRLKMAFNPKSHDAALSHYIPAVQYADSGVENSIWRTDLQDRIEDWKGDTGRVYSKQVLTTQGPLLFPIKVVPQAGLGGTSVVYGQYVTQDAVGSAGRPLQIDATTAASEFVQVQE
jgi:hypothetical protein